MPAQKVELSISTQSQPMSSDPQPAVVAPKITMNGTPLPLPHAMPSSPCGWQVVVIDAVSDMTNPASIRFDDYLSLRTQSGSWSATYPAMYQAMVRGALLAGNTQQQLVIVASFGLDRNMPPTNDGLDLLLEYGAGPQLQKWELGANPGSQAGGSKQLVAMPANYILVGYSSHSYGMGNEIFETSPGGETLHTNLTVTLTNPVPPTPPSG